MSQDKEELDGYLERLYKLNPALVRGALVSIASLLAMLVGHAVISSAQIDTIINVLTGLTAVIGAVWTRGAVTPNAKVVVYKPDPVNAPTEVAAGPATINPTQANQEAVLDAAVSDGEEDLPSDEPPEVPTLPPDEGDGMAGDDPTAVGVDDEGDTEPSTDTRPVPLAPPAAVPPAPGA